MQSSWKNLFFTLALPLMVGAFSALLTQNTMETFAALNQPPLSPPGWVFPVVWTILYVMMGLASYFMLAADAEDAQRDRAWDLYGFQLLLNFLWPLLFFRFDRCDLALICLILLWVVLIATIISFFRISKKAGLSLIPYLLWVTFAGYLNIGFCVWNP